jgi:hypothetical protein
VNENSVKTPAHDLATHVLDASQRLPRRQESQESPTVCYTSIPTGSGLFAIESSDGGGPRPAHHQCPQAAGGIDIAGGEGPRDGTAQYPGAARCGPAAGIGVGSFRWMPGDTGHSERDEHEGEDDQAGEDMACSVPVTPGWLASG